MKVISCVDYMATIFGSTEEEYADVESTVRDIFPDVELEFKTGVLPHALDAEEHEFDIYVFDWGGLMLGAEDLTRSIYRSLLAQVRKHETSKLFIMWSLYTEQYYKDAVEEEFPEFIAPNVVFMMGDFDVFYDRSRKFFGLGKLPDKPDNPDDYKLVTPPQRPRVGREESK